MTAPDPDTPAGFLPPVGRRLARALAVVLPLLALSVVLCLGIGAQPLSPAAIWHSLREVGWGIFGAAGPDWTPTDSILWTLRFPRVVAGVLVGVCLAGAGVTFQGLLRNPLADPYLIGVSAGAATGWAIAVLFGFDRWAGGLGMTVIGFAAGMTALALVYRLAQAGGRLAMESFILAGVVVGAFMWSALVLVMTLLRPFELREVFFFLLGNFTAVRWEMVVMLAVAAALGFAGLWWQGRTLNLLALGEETAGYLGVEVAGAQRRLIVLGAVLTAAAVAASGVIGFIGLVMPHLARRVVGADHRVLLPVAGCVGAVFLLWADALARGLNDVFPVGVLTAVLGAPFFLYVLRRARR